MRQLFWFLLFYSFALFGKAQADVANNGTLYITGNSDTFFISGNFTNASSAAFTNNGKFYTNQNFTNNQASTAVGTGELILNGTGAQSISTTSTSPFYKLTIEKPSGLATLASAVTVNYALNLNAGKLSLDNYDMTVANSATINGAGANTYLIAVGSGVLKQQIAALGSKAFPVGTAAGYTPVTISLALFSTTDVFNVRMLPAVYSSGTTGSQMNSNSVNATWMISENVAGGSNASLTCQWPASFELTGFNRVFSRLAHYTSAAWEYGLMNIAASGSDPYTVTRSGFTDFSPFAVTMFMAVLPVRSLELSGTNNANENYIKWATAEERNSSYFIVEASKNGVDFFETGRVNAAGNSTALRQYNFVHKEISGQTYYYRIKQVDVNGQWQYSKVIRIAPSVFTSINLYPNPVKDKTTLRFSLKQASVVTTLVSSTAGNIVYTSKKVYNKGDYAEVLNLTALPAATYILQLKDETGALLTTRFIKTN